MNIEQLAAAVVHSLLNDEEVLRLVLLLVLLSLFYNLSYMQTMCNHFSRTGCDCSFTFFAQCGHKSTYTRCSREVSDIMRVVSFIPYVACECADSDFQRLANSVLRHPETLQEVVAISI